MGLFGSKKYEDISATEFADKMKNTNAIILDVRTPGEVAEGKIPGAIHIDVHNPGFLQEATKLDKEKELLVYCRSGGRSGMACGMLAKNGYTSLYNLSGGIMGWNGPVE